MGSEQKMGADKAPGLQCPLLFDVAIPVDTAAFKEAVAHHALAKEKKSDCQDDKKQEQSNLRQA
jgi:hypothetical protein